MRLNLTKQFCKFIDDQCAETGIESPTLRVIVVGGGCQGYQYQLVMEPQKSDDVVMYRDQFLLVTTDPKSAALLDKAILNYEGGLNGRGVTFSNPNASSCCGCGLSFSCEMK